MKFHWLHRKFWLPFLGLIPDIKFLQRQVTHIFTDFKIKYIYVTLFSWQFNIMMLLILFQYLFWELYQAKKQKKAIGIFKIKFQCIIIKPVEYISYTHTHINYIFAVIFIVVKNIIQAYLLNLKTSTKQP